MTRRASWLAPLLRRALARIAHAKHRRGEHQLTEPRACTLLLILLAGIFPLTGCKAQGTPRKVVILKWATHPALDEVESAFERRLNESLKSRPDLAPVEIRKLNASANPQRAAQLAETAVRLNPAFIVTFGTPASQAVARLPSDIPLFYAAVSDPEGAGLFQHEMTTGISNVGPRVIEQAMDFIRLLVPDSKTIATIYNPAEQNSVYVQQMIERAARLKSFRLEQRRVSDPSQIASIAEELSQKADVFYCANDNTVNIAVASLAAVASAARRPFVIGELSAIGRGPTAAVGVDYTETGTSLAEMAVVFLAGAKWASITPQPPPASKARLSKKQCALIGLTPPPPSSIQYEEVP